MNRFILITCLLVIAATSYAAKSTLPVDGLGIRVQTFAPDGKQAQALTSRNSLTVNITDNVQYAVFALQSSCKFRNQSTATKAGSLRYLPKGNVYNRGVNGKTPFINMSACTNAVLELQ